MNLAAILGANVTPILVVFLGFTVISHEAIRRWKNRKLIKFMAQFDGPIALPIVGTLYIFLKQLTTTNVVRFLLNYVQTSPETAAHWINGEPYLITCDREIVAAVTSSSKNINKTKEYNAAKVLSHGIFTAAGMEWRKTRKMINPGFRSNVLDTFGENTDRHIDIFMEKVKEQAKSGEEFDVFRMVHAFTLDALCENMMGVQLDIQKKKLYNYSIAVEKSVQLFFERAFNPVLWPPSLYSLSGQKAELEGFGKEMRRLAELVLEKRIRERESQNREDLATDKPSPFMDLLLKGVEAGEVTREQCIEEIIEMFLAGSLTSAILISWVIKGGAFYPHLAERARQEIVDTCGVRKITYSDLSNLPYLDMVVKETLRHVTLPVVARNITTDLKVNDKLTIPPGVQVVISLFQLHHDPRYWEKPNEFYPEHFSPENEMKRPKGVFMPFSTGPRNCPGNTYAMRTIKLMMANLVLNFECTSSEPAPKDIINDLDYRIVFLVYPMKGFKVRVMERAKKQEQLPANAAA